MTCKKFDPIRNKSAEIIEFIMSAPEIPADDMLEFKIRLSVEEVVENVVRYAYEDGAGEMEVSVNTEDNNPMLTITVVDQGVPFNPLDKPDPDITLSAEERQIGGLGIFLCKKMMDEVTYHYEGSSNILTMKKKVIAE